MPKAHLRHISGLMAIFMLLMSIGVSVDVHYCGAKLYSIGFNTQAETCPGFENGQDFPESDAQSLHRKSCCTDHNVHIQSDGDFSQEIGTYVFDWDVTPLYSLSELNIRSNHQMVPFSTYSPPDPQFERLAITSILRI